MLANRAAKLVDSFVDVEDASDVVECLAMALQVAIIVAAHDQRDALRVMDAVHKDIKDDIKKNFKWHREIYERRFDSETAMTPAQRQYDLDLAASMRRMAVWIEPRSRKVSDTLKIAAERIAALRQPASRSGSAT